MYPVFLQSSSRGYSTGFQAPGYLAEGYFNQVKNQKSVVIPTERRNLFLVGQRPPLF